jgi:hypothetical protein
MRETIPMRSISPLPLRLPEGVREKIKASALANRRSMNSEIVVALEKLYFDQPTNEKGSVSA